MLNRVFPEPAAYEESLELSRFVLADDMPANGESWFIGQLLRLAASDGNRGIVSFADPMARPRIDGGLMFPGHLGIIHQAAGFIYTGRSTPRTLCVPRNGSVASARALSKARQLEVGHEYVTRPGQDSASWLREALQDAGARTLRHPGNHRYCVRVGRTRAERTRAVIGLAASSYPKHRTGDSR